MLRKIILGKSNLRSRIGFEAGLTPRGLNTVVGLWCVLSLFNLKLK